MDCSSQHTSQQQVPDLDWELVLGLLPNGWDEQARQLGAFQRPRKVKDPQGLLRLVLMHCGAGLSFQRTAEAARCTQLATMAKASVWERVQRVGPWLNWMLTAMLAERVSAAQIADYRPRAVDATAINGPNNRLQHRLHYSISVASLSCDDLVISDVRKPERLEHFSVVSGDLLIGDRIYAKAKGIAAVKRAKGDVIVRLGRTSLALYDATGARLDWLAWLRQASSDQLVERFAQFPDSDGRWITGRLCAVRLSEQQAEKARCRCRRAAQRKQTKLHDATLEAAGYVCVFTTVPADRLSTRMILRLYRARWQIELAFKRLKSLLRADQLRETTAESALIWLQGKLLYALLLQACLKHAGAFSPR